MTVAAAGFLFGLLACAIGGAVIDYRRDRLAAARCLLCGEVFEDPADFLNHRCRIPRPAA